MKAAADMVGADLGKLPGTVEMRGYSKVDESDVLESQSSSSGRRGEVVERWTTAQVSSYLRMRLLEYEGSDEETVDEILRTFEEREVREIKFRSEHCIAQTELSSAFRSMGKVFSSLMIFSCFMTLTLVLRLFFLFDLRYN
jgi:hypothetical protein